MWKQCQISFSWAPKSMQTVTVVTKLRYLILGKIVMTKLDSVLKSRDITLLRKVYIVKAMVFPAVIYRCGSWTIKRLFSSSSLSAIKEVSSAYLTLLIFLLTILIPVCDSPSPAFHMMYSAYKLNKQL